jgi:hypothetical protein
MKQIRSTGLVTSMYLDVLPQLVEQMKRVAAAPAEWTRHHDKILAILFRQNTPGSAEIAKLRAETLKNMPVLPKNFDILYSNGKAAIRGNKITITYPKPKKAKAV